MLDGTGTYIEICGHLSKDIIIKEVSQNVRCGVIDIAIDIDTTGLENVKPKIVFKVFMRNQALLKVYGSYLKKDTKVWVTGELSFIIKQSSSVQKAFKLNSKNIITNVYADKLVVLGLNRFTTSINNK